MRSIDVHLQYGFVIRSAQVVVISVCLQLFLIVRAFLCGIVTLCPCRAPYYLLLIKLFELCLSFQKIKKST